MPSNDIRFELLLPGILALVVVLAVGPLIIWVSRQMGLLDIPLSLEHKRHKNPTPIAGGLILVAVLVLIATLSRVWQIDHIRVIIFGSLIVFLFGLTDDFLNLSVPVKLAGQILAGGYVIYHGYLVRFLDNVGSLWYSPEQIDWLNIIVTLIWLVGITNAMNFLDSMDGQVAGLGLVTFLLFLGATVESGQEELAWLTITLVGICVGLLFYNISPPRLFLGDSGAQTLGFLAAAIGMIYVPKNLNPLSTWFVPIMLLLVPIFDTTLVVVSRIRAGKPIFQAGLDHTYHRLKRMGSSEQRAVLLIQLSAVILGGLALIIMVLPPLAANLFFGIVLLILLLLMILAFQFTD